MRNRAAITIHEACPNARFLALGDEATIYGNELSYLAGKSFKQHVLEAGAVCESFFCSNRFFYTPSS